MTLEAAFLDMMTQTVTVYDKDSVDAYGKVSHDATGTVWRCRIMERLNRQTTEDTRYEFEGGTIIFYGSPTITTDSKILLPDGTTPIITGVNRHLDEDGSHHTTVTFGR